MEPLRPWKVQLETNNRAKPFELTWGSIVKVPVVALGCFVIYLLLPFIMLLFLSALLAITFEPATAHLARLTGRKSAVALITLFAAAIVAGLGFLVVPELITQATNFYHRVPEFAADLSSRFPIIAKHLGYTPAKIPLPDTATLAPILLNAAHVSALAAGALSSLILIFAFTIYLLLDGARVCAWLLAFFSDQTKLKLEQTYEGVAPVISAYVLGQMVTSTLCATFTYLSLWWLGVPAALVLAVLAGIFDILPIIGFFLFAIPAALFALTVSTNTALLTFLAFGVYHMIETYLVSPMVYGNRLRVSGFVVLSSLIAGGTIGGIIGAIAVLPVVASYPVIERIWLKRFLGHDVISEHTEIATE